MVSGEELILLQETHTHNKDLFNQLKNSFSDYTIFKSDSVEESYASIITLISGTIDWDINKIWEIKGRALAVKLEKENRKILLLNVYCPAQMESRKGFIMELETKLEHQMTIFDSIVIMGDFNFVENFELDRDNHNVTSTAKYKAMAGHKEFKNIKRLCGLEDVFRYKNPNKWQYSCTNKATKTRSRIDRLYGSISVVEGFQSMSSRQFCRNDHRLISYKINTFSLKQKMGKGYWKLNNSLLPKTDELIDQAFLDFQFAGENITYWWDDFKKYLKEILIKKAEVIKLEEKQRVGQIEREIRLVNDGVLDPSLKHSLEADLELEKYREKYKLLLGNRYMLEKLDQISLKTAKSISKKNAANRFIYAIKDGEEIRRDQKGIEKALVRQYSELFKSSGTCETSINKLLEFTENKISNQKKRLLESEIVEKEVETAIQQLKDNKVPGLDGLTNEFYKKFQRKLIPLLTKLFNQMHDGKILMPTMYTGVITLLHKGGDRTERKNFRPLTLSNTDYKLLAKVLTNRLSSTMGDLVHQNQNSGVKGRNIQDGVLLFNNILEHCSRFKRNGLVLSVDQMAAFDRVEWKYMIRVLKHFGLGKNFLSWVELIYKTEHLKVKLMINGSLSSDVNIGRGVRQGCPLSPLLYVLAIEPLANLIRRSREIPGLGCAGKEYKLSMYADDTNLFLEKFSDIKKVFEAYKQFGKASGGKLKEEKTKILLLGITKLEDCPEDYQNYVTENLKVYGYWFKKDGVNNEKNFEKINQIIEELGEPPHISTYIARVRALNTYRLSNIWYNLYVSTPTQALSKQLENKMIGYIWYPYRTGIDRCIQKLNVNKGGLALPDLELKRLAFRSVFLYKYETEQPEWKMIFKSVLNRVDKCRNQPQIMRETNSLFYYDIWRLRKKFKFQLIDGNVVLINGIRYLRKNISSKTFYEILVKKSININEKFADYEISWSWDFDKIFSDEEWSLIHENYYNKRMASPQAKNLHYRLINRAAYPLARINQGDAANCVYCFFTDNENIEEDIFHKNHLCPRSAFIWTLAENFLARIGLELTEENKIFGFFHKNVKHKVIANLIILEAQYVIWKHGPENDIQRNLNHLENLSNHFIAMIKSQIKKASKIMSPEGFKSTFAINIDGEAPLVDFSETRWRILM